MARLNNHCPLRLPETCRSAVIRPSPVDFRGVVIGEVTKASPGMVTMQTGFGGERIVDMLVGEQLPRIC